MPFENKIAKQLRREKNLTQKQLADLIGISAARYSSWERGEKQPSMDFIQKIAIELNCKINRLVSAISEDYDEFEDQSINDRSSSFWYFIEERSDEKRWSLYSEELIVKLDIFDKPMNFSMSDDSSKKTIHALENGSHDFIWIETYDNKMFHLNTKNIEWIVLHNEAADAYPDISSNNFHETPLMLADMTKGGTLFMMARNGNFDFGDCDYALLEDFEWLIKTGSRLIDEVPDIVNGYKEEFKDNYLNFVSDSKDTGYPDQFLNAWGIRIYLKNGKNIFLPGLVNRGESWDEGIYEIKQMDLWEDNIMTSFSDFERLNRFYIPTKDIVLVEYPSVFDIIGHLYEEGSFEEIDAELVDKKVEELYYLVWCEKENKSQ